MIGTNASMHNREIQQHLSHAALSSRSIGASGGKVYLKSVNLLLNGKPMQSLTLEPATEKENYGHYYLFAKATGCVNSGMIFISSIMKYATS